MLSECTIHDASFLAVRENDFSKSDVAHFHLPFLIESNDGHRNDPKAFKTDWRIPLTAFLFSE